MKRYIANFITGCRILFSLLMLLFPVFSFWFYIMYLSGGITDIIDGTIARKTNSASAFGSHLDTAADVIFTASAFIKVLPSIAIPKWALIWIIVIVAVKTANILHGLIRSKLFFAEHTVLNKITGLLLFLLPLTFSFIKPHYSIASICSIATAAAIQEGYYIRKEREI